jgi:hypothetical protein
MPDVHSDPADNLIHQLITEMGTVTIKESSPVFFKDGIAYWKDCTAVTNPHTHEKEKERMKTEPTKGGIPIFQSSIPTYQYKPFSVSSEPIIRNLLTPDKLLSMDSDDD